MNEKQKIVYNAATILMSNILSDENSMKRLREKCNKSKVTPQFAMVCAAIELYDEVIKVVK